jgi:hypothetical protein
MNITVRATPHLNRCTATSSRQPAAATPAWTACKDRAAAPHLPQREQHPITIMSPAQHTPRVVDQDKHGRPRAHKRHSASTTPVKRSALGPPGRPTGDRRPPLALDDNEWSQWSEPRDHVDDNRSRTA